MKHKRKVAAAMIAAAMALQTIPLSAIPMTVHADGEWSKFNAGVTTRGASVIHAPKSPEQGTDAWTGSYVYYGQYQNQPVKYRVLSPRTSVFGGTTMFLDCDTTLFVGLFREDSEASDRQSWKASDLYKILNTNDDAFLKTSFSGAEAEAIAGSSRAAHALVVGENAGNVTSRIQETFVNYVPLTGEKSFCWMPRMFPT